MSSGKRAFTLYWSSLDTFEGCPQRFLWGRGWGAIDVGGGPGRPKPKPVQKSEHHAVLGTVIQAVVERFYSDALWASLGPEVLRERLLQLADEHFKLEIARRFIDWRLSPTRQEMEQTIRDGVLGYMKTLKAHRLLGSYAKAEVDLVGYVNNYTPIGGRADVVIKRDQDPNKGTMIIDGKNGKRYKDGHGGLKTYTDPDQLRWYALCFYLAYHHLPDRLGFCYYRYPYGSPALDANGRPTGKTEEGIEWVTFTQEDLKGLAQRAVDARKGMDFEKFPAKPDPQGCRFCDYDTVCPERVGQKDQNRRSPGKQQRFEDVANLKGFTLLEM